MSGIEKLFGEDEIKARIDTLAREIFDALPANFVAVGLLKGSFMFIADLIRALDRLGARPGVEFMRLSSYGLKQVSAGEVHLIGDVPTDLTGRDVLVVDDILDTGRSIAYARALLLQRKVRRLWTCVLLDKPSRREVEVPVDFVGFTVDDVFVAGYGIDYAERYRHLPYIGAITDKP